MKDVVSKLSKMTIELKSTFHPSSCINNKRQWNPSGTLKLIRLIVLCVEVVIKAEDIIQVSFWVPFGRRITKEQTPERINTFSYSTLMITNGNGSIKKGTWN